MPEVPFLRVPSTDGVELALHDLGGDGPPLLIAHATGFCAGAYRPLAPILAERFHVWGIDLRGHGDSSSPATEAGFDWQHIAGDVLAAVDAIDAGPVVGFGHSLGGGCLMAAELQRPGTVARAYLFEPIIHPDAWDGASGPNFMSEAALRRRATFPSHAEALARYARRPPLSVLRADALAAYVDHGFRETAGGVELKCRPAAEAATFAATGKPRVGEMPAVRTPSVVARGGRDGEFGPAAFAGGVAEALPNGELRRYPHVGHFGPLADPDTFAAEAAAFLARDHAS